MSLLIGLGNKARQGKDLAAQALLDHIDRKNKIVQRYYGAKDQVKAQVFRFAGALYEECRVLHGMTTKDAPLLQKVGAARRVENPDYWVNRVFVEIDPFFLTFPKGVAIITDVRHKNEAAKIKEYGGYLINISTLNADGTPFITDDRPADHPSEIDLDGYLWDARIQTYRNQEALAAELAITTYEYLKGLHS